MRLDKKVVAYVLAGCLLIALSLPLTVQAQGPEVTAESAIVMDLDSGFVLFEKDSQSQHFPASITKIMTALVALENSAMEEELTFSHDSVWNIEGSHIWRGEGEVLTMEQALHGLMLNSANDCAYAIAEHVGGTYENFIQMMNEKAATLGAVSSHFVNPHGLPSEEHVVTAHDMALIAQAAFQNEIFRTLISTEHYVIPPTNIQVDSTYLRNGHRMIRHGGEMFYDGAIGGKTGYTEAAGNTLVTFAQRDGIRLVSVVLKDKTPDHYMDTKALLDYGFANHAALHPAMEEATAVEADVTEATSVEMSADGEMIQDDAAPSTGAVVTDLMERQQYVDSIFWLIPASIVPLGIAIVLVFVRTRPSKAEKVLRDIQKRNQK